MQKEAWFQAFQIIQAIIARKSEGQNFPTQKFKYLHQAETSAHAKSQLSIHSFNRVWAGKTLFCEIHRKKFFLPNLPADTSSYKHNNINQSQFSTKSAENAFSLPYGPT